ncbi:NACHT domain-containing protein [Commensalibacter communis]|uniref:NACHT domain-containing protein n=1 Tax=Commensalibacter communis TaxID=2972786 RepID=UPI0022FF9ED5|nr:NACHT domain-containing protein [Commensalibacter communis]CAI3933959.1 NACHT family domain (NACHT) [Commensalibacter communis]CAI3944228.1 NACHT family domain (NACHT) [Commensalibacter communis]
MITTSSIVAGWAVQAGIRKVVDTSIDKAIKTKWKSIFSKGKTIVEQLSQQETYDIYLEKHLYSTMKMRTIHSVDKDVLLNQIYHPLTITVHQNPQIVKDGFVYENNEITNIIGYAGQGKSTILRKIFLETLTYGKKIPFFMELRRIESDGVIKSLNLILDQFRVKASQEDIANLLESGNILLLLDGFDEVKTEYRNQLLKEIFHLNKKYNTQIIITSRHDTEICREAGVSNFYVEPIGQTDIIAIIEKSDHHQNTDVKDYFNIKEILQNNQSLVETINTPLLATLFYICYPHLDSIPENAIDFYDRLFVTLYLHHDKSKNYTREKKANLDKHQAYQCFCALCFLSIYENRYDFTEQSILEYIKKAAKITNINDIAVENIFDDFIEITSLIQRDGYDHIVFLHKSVQEYHAAQFIQNSSIEQKIIILKAVYQNFTDANYSLYQVVMYLYERSKYDVIVNILMPLCEEIGFDCYYENKESIIKNYYHHIEKMEMGIEYQKDKKLNKYCLELDGPAWERSSDKQILLLEALSGFTYYQSYKNSDDVCYDTIEDIYNFNNLDGKIIEMVYDFFKNILDSDFEFYKHSFLKLGNDNYAINGRIINSIPMKKIIIYLKKQHEDLFHKKIEALIDQLYNDTYVQYLKETQQEKDNLMELLHL